MNSNNNLTNSRKSLSSQIAYYFSGRVIAQIFALIVPLILVRYFTPSDFGLFRQVLLIYVIFFRILPFGFRNALYYFISNDFENKAIYTTNTFLFFLFIGLINFLFLTLFKTEIALFFNSPEIELYLPLCGIYILLMLLSCHFEVLFVSIDKAEIASYVTVSSEIIRSLSLVCLVFYFSSVSGAIYGLITFSLLRLIAFIFYNLKYYSSSFKLKDNLFKFKSQLNYSLPMGASSLIGTTYKKIDRVMILAFYNPEIFAIYSVGSYHVPFLNLLFNSTGNVTIPRAVTLLKENKVNPFLKLWHSIIIRMSFVGLGSFFIFQLVAEDFITLLFTEQYSESVVIFQIGLFLIFAHMLLYGIILRSMGLTRDVFKSNFIAFVVSIPLAYYMVSWHGIHGAAITAVCLFYINAFLQINYTRIRLEKSFSEILPVYSMMKLFSLSLILFYVFFTLQDFTVIELFNLAELNKIARILIVGFSFITAYIYLSRILGIFDIFQEKFIRDFLKNGRSQTNK